MSAWKQALVVVLSLLLLSTVMDTASAQDRSGSTHGRCLSRPHYRTYGPSLTHGPYHSYTFGKCQAMRLKRNGTLSDAKDFAFFTCGAFVAAGWPGFAGGIACAAYVLVRYQGFKNAFNYALNHRGKCPEIRAYVFANEALIRDPSRIHRCYYPG